MRAWDQVSVSHDIIARADWQVPNLETARSPAGRIDTAADEC
jgi:hypothetical protein